MASPTNDVPKWPEGYKGADMPVIRVTPRALQQRINYQMRLNSDAYHYRGEVLHKARGQRQRQDLGEYYVITDTGTITETHVDLVKKATSLGVWYPGEKLNGQH